MELLTLNEKRLIYNKKQNLRYHDSKIKKKQITKPKPKIRLECDSFNVNYNICYIDFDFDNDDI